MKESTAGTSVMVPWLAVASGRHAPKRIDCQVHRVRLLAAFDAHGLVPQPARLEAPITIVLGKHHAGSQGRLLMWGGEYVFEGAIRGQSLYVIERTDRSKAEAYSHSTL